MKDKSTRQERMDLIWSLKQKAKASQLDSEARIAWVLAEFEKEPAARYPEDNPAWAEITAEASKFVEQADAQLAKRCRELGIRKEFRQEIGVSWSSRGENADKRRRQELRDLAERITDAMAKSAKAEIQRNVSTFADKILMRGMGSVEAQKMFAQLPTFEQLMPKLKLEELEKKLPLTDDYGRMLGS